MTAVLLALNIMAAPAYQAAAVDESIGRTANTAGSITLDGDDGDWAGIDGVQLNHNVQGYTLTGWKAAMDEEGSVYMCITGNGNQWSVPNLKWDGMLIVQNGQYIWHQFNSLWQMEGVKHVVCSDAGSESGPFVLEMSIPANFFKDPNFLLTYSGVNLPASSLPVLDGSEVPGKEEAVYSGIVIDGDFSDWDAVAKTDGPRCTNEGHPDCMESCAMVFDGDYVYIYLREYPGMNAGSAGSHGNGNFAITTDLGRTLLIDLESNGTVNGLDGAKCTHNGTQWEIAIPSSALPEYRKSIHFGFYQAEPVITDVVNLEGSSGNVGEFSGIVCDGEYSDWEDYPHTLIQYATPGTQATVPDGESAIYAEGSALFGHTVTEYAPHLVGGHDLAYAITIAFNGERDYKATPSDGNLYPYLVKVDDAGNISYPYVGNLPKGTHEFYIMDTRSWHSSTNIKDLQGNDMIFGRMMITIEDGREECEYEIDLEKVAAYIGCDVSDLKLIEAQFGRIGQQWTSCAGASSGAVLGVALCLAAVGAVILVRKRRHVCE